MAKKKKTMATTTTPLPAGWPLQKKIVADATTWVMRGEDGLLQRIKVVDMTDGHLFRWIQLFRRKYREEGGRANMADDLLDLQIKASIVTAPAIYAEAAKRGLYVSAQASVVVEVKPPVTAVPVPGRRLITLNEED